MKKFDIIVEYNSLASELRSAIDNYNALTGEDYTRQFTNNIFYVMDSSRCMTWGKDELERYLANRQRLIANCKRDTEVYQKTKEMKSTEKGQAFITSLKKRQDDIMESLHQVSKEFVDKFNEMLALADLENWKVVWRPQDHSEMPHLLPSFHHEYFDIWMEKSKYSRVHITINHDRDGWEMQVSTGLQGGTTLGKPSDEFNCFKAYVTICEHSRAFQIWMENTYRDLASKAYDLLNELEKADEDVRDPYAAWVRENS